MDIPLSPDLAILRLMLYSVQVLKSKSRLLFHSLPVSNLDEVLILHEATNNNYANRSEIARAMFMPFSATAKIIDRLVTRDLVYEVQDDIDARMKNVHATPEGRMVCVTALILVEEALQVLLARLSDAERTTLKNLLFRFRWPDVLSEVPGMPKRRPLISR